MYFIVWHAFSFARCARCRLHAPDVLSVLHTWPQPFPVEEACRYLHNAYLHSHLSKATYMVRAQGSLA